MIRKARLAVGLTSVGVAAAALFPASAGAVNPSICTTNCGGGVPPGLPKALTVLETNPNSTRITGDPDEGGQVAVADAALSANHNETVLRLD